MHATEALATQIGPPPPTASGSLGTEGQISSLLWREILSPEPPQRLSRHQRRCVASDQVGRAARKSSPSQCAISARDRPSTKGKGPRHSSAEGGPRNTRSSIRGWCCRRFSKWFYGSSFAFVAVTVAACFGGVEGPLVQVARILGIVGSYFFCCGPSSECHRCNSSRSYSTSNGLNTAENIWRGVDVQNLNIRCCAGIMTVEGEEFLREWLNTNAATTLVPCLNQGLMDQMLAAIGSISLSMTTIQRFATPHFFQPYQGVGTTVALMAALRSTMTWR